jgi:hypothetical protein
MIGCVSSAKRSEHNNDEAGKHQPRGRERVYREVQAVRSKRSLCNIEDACVRAGGAAVTLQLARKCPSFESTKRMNHEWRIFWKG